MNQNVDFDVIVAGGGVAGSVAAIASARLGARTLLVERNHCLGGAATMRNVLTWCGIYTLGASQKQVVYGIADEILAAQKKMGGLGPIKSFRGVFVPFDPETLKSVLDHIVSESGIQILFGSSVLSAMRHKSHLTRVLIANHGGQTAFNSKAFVDCTGDGDLAQFGGASIRYGNPEGVNLGTLGCRFGGIPSNIEITVDNIIDAIESKKFPEGTITKDRCVIVRLPKSSDLVLYLASLDFDPRDGETLARAETDCRRQAWNYLEALQTIPGCKNAYLVSTGPEIGTRESRHLNCLYQFTWSDVMERKSHNDSIALGCWGAEWHDRHNFKSDFDYPPDKSSYQIPLNCLHSRDTPNLFCAGRLADGDRKGGAAIRVLGTSMATGQAAGTAAALTAKGKFSPLAVQTELRRAGAVIEQSEL